MPGPRRAAPVAGAWLPIETAPRDGHEILCTDGGNIRVCYPLLFPRPITAGDDMSKSRAGDRWEYFRSEEFAPGHTWTMVPTHWQPLPAPPTEAGSPCLNRPPRSPERVALEIAVHALRRAQTTLTVAVTAACDLPDFEASDHAGVARIHNALMQIAALCPDIDT